MSRSIRPDAVLVQAVIAGALSFAHLHDLADAAGQTGWKAWAYPISVDLLLVAAWRRLRTARKDRSAWTWFVIALFASLGANIATAGLLDLHNVPAWLCILVAGWPALAFLGGTLLVHAPTDTPAPAESRSQPVDEPGVTEADMRRADPPAPPAAPELPAALPEPAVPAVTVPAALLDHARKIAESHRATTGTPMAADALSARLGLPGPMTAAIAAQLQLT
ncbi:DUF2637 domain-containing protein [Streptomyces olivochromogenes]|uniref:SpdA2 protein n=1 Tax=Streptomyces olivochromogenes TaxID=1963 RepID=A0A250V7U7_STROL|nr:DUF2637 domain-containing protein [Streptomyces olivochromogenes]KUN45649.1 SpdA protein [Streptomyces olivochromogenes]GAX50182.1 SpdA2 protein [Streptomyces olivochromogenes]